MQGKRSIIGTVLSHQSLGRLLNAGVLLLLFLAFITDSARAQSGGQDAQIMAIKSGFLSERMKLDPSEGKAFWPLYYQYEAEKRALRSEFKSKFPEDLTRLSEEESLAFVNARLEYEQQRLEIKKKYRSQFLTKISAWQLAQLYEGERDFRRLLIRRLRSSHRPNSR